MNIAMRTAAGLRPADAVQATFDPIAAWTPTVPPPIDVERPWSDRVVGARRLSTFDSSYVGIVHRLFEQLHDVDDINVVGVGAQACSSWILIGEHCNELNGGGAVTTEAATAAAIGETSSGTALPGSTIVRSSSLPRDSSTS